MSMGRVIWAFELTGVSPVAKLAAIELANNGDTALPLAMLVDFCVAPEEQVLAALDELQATGKITIVVDGDTVLTKFTLPPFIRTFVFTNDASPRVDMSPCSIYVIAAETRTKIGISSKAEVRMENLQKWTPEALRLVWSGRGPRNIIREIEAASHAELSANRIAGEWFDVTPGRAVEIVKSHMAKRGLK